MTSGPAARAAAPRGRRTCLPRAGGGVRPDVSDLVEVRRGPEMSAIASGAPVHCPDTLREERWPEYAREALLRGVRSSVALAHRSGPAAVTLSLFGARPQTRQQDQLPVAELLIAVGSAVLGNASEFRQTDAR